MFKNLSWGNICFKFVTMKKTEVTQSEEWKYKSYQSLVKWHIISLVIDSTFIFSRYTLISSLIIKQTVMSSAASSSQLCYRNQRISVNYGASLLLIIRVKILNKSILLSVNVSKTAGRVRRIDSEHRSSLILFLVLRKHAYSNIYWKFYNGK